MTSAAAILVGAHDDSKDEWRAIVRGSLSCTMQCAPSGSDRTLIAMESARAVAQQGAMHVRADHVKPSRD